MPQSLSQIKAMLDDLGMHPRKRFGQNFLHDQNKLNQIVQAAQLTSDDVVLEVGPGTGTLTETMLETGAKVIAVEIDRDLAFLLSSELQPKYDNFTLIEGDAMDGKHALHPEIRKQLQDRPFKLIANLPYNIASPLLMNLTRDYQNLMLGLIMVQFEVAERFVATHGSKDFSPLSIVLQSTFEAQRLMKLPPSCFWPAPKVDSAVVQLVRREQPLTRDVASLTTFSHQLFQKRRKQIGSILGRTFPFPEGIDPNQRPETLTLEQVIALMEIDKQSKQQQQQQQ